MHGVQNAAVHGLQTIADVWQGAVSNNAHRVVDERIFHLSCNRDLQNATITINGNWTLYIFVIIFSHNYCGLPLFAESSGCRTTAPSSVFVTGSGLAL